MKIKKIAIIIGLTIIPMILLCNNVFQVVSEKQDELIIEFNLSEYKIIEKNIDSEIYHEISASNAALLIKEGYPKLPFFVKAVGLPVDGDVSFTILKKNEIIKNNINIIPNSKIVYNSDETITYQFYKDENYYNSGKFYPQDLLTKNESAFAGDRKFAGLQVKPFQYSDSQKKLKIISYLKFKINISGLKKETGNWRLANNYIDEVGDEFFLNNQFSKKWRKEKEKSDYQSPGYKNGEISKLQIIVDSVGIYKLTKTDLKNWLVNYEDEHETDIELSYNFDDVDPRYFELYDEDGPVAIHFKGESDGSFDEGDYFEFYGDIHHGEEGFYDDYTAENTYILEYVNHLGCRMAVENGGLEVTSEDDFRIPESYYHSMHFEQQNSSQALESKFNTNYNYYKEDTWFWGTINAPNLDYLTFDLQYPEETQFRKFSAEVCLFGLTYPDGPEGWDHHAIVRINNSLINDHKWSGQNEQMFVPDEPISNDYLVHGENTLYVSLPGLDGVALEETALDYFDIHYWREYKTDEDYIKFAKPKNKPYDLYQFEIDGFTTSDISVYEIGSSIMEHTQITKLNETENSPYRLSFQDSVLAEDVKYYAVTESKKMYPKEIKPDFPSDLRNPTNSAEYIIITPTKFKESEGTLLLEEIWENQGVDVQIVDLQDIFDEFNHGIRSAQSIKDFLTYAYHNWTIPTLSHVLLLGDGTSDERDFSPEREFNLIPVKHLWSQGRGKIACDNWYSTIIGEDPVPDFALSRIPIWKEEQILEVANKSQQYIENPNYEDLWHSKITLTSGKLENDVPIYAQQSEALRNNYVPDSYNVNRIYSAITSSDGEVFGDSCFYGGNSDLLDAINNGTVYAQFIGHGASQVWGDNNLLNLADVASLNNNNYPFLTSLACFCSAFNGDQSDCIGEEMIIAPEKGAIGHFGFTGYGYANPDYQFGRKLFNGIFNLGIRNIGDIINYSKASMYLQSNISVAIERALIDGGALLGDPMISLNLPKEEVQVNLNTYNAEPGDTLEFSAQVDENTLQGKFVIFNENDAQIPLGEYFPIMQPAVNSTISINNYIVPETQNGAEIYSNTIKLFAFSDEAEYTGQTSFTVGYSAEAHITLDPPEPTYRDSVIIRGEFFDKDGVDSVRCYVETRLYEMSNIEGNTYTINSYITGNHTGQKKDFYFEIIDNNGNLTTTDNYYYIVRGPLLLLRDNYLTEFENSPAIGVLVKNSGNMISEECGIKLYKYNSDEDDYGLLVDSLWVESIPALGKTWKYLKMPMFSGTENFKIVIDEEFNQDETDWLSFSLNMFEVGEEEVSESSLDGNLECHFPAEITSDNAVFYIENEGEKDYLNQPDIYPICLADSSYSHAYKIDTFNSNILADTLGHFINNQRVELRFNYHSNNEETQSYESEGNFSVYRWNEEFQKWVFMMRGVEPENDQIIFEAGRTGIYSVFRNEDEVIPSIDANAEGQEFSHGGYISKNGIISIILNDANGIDIVNNDIYMELNGEMINEDKYTLSLSQGHLIHIPIKYQLENFSKGNYNLSINCTDVNGNSNTREIPFEVRTDFGIENIANYPNPVKSGTIDPINEGRTRFTYVLTDDADDVKMKIYTVSGRLVKTFKNLPTSVGYHEYPRTVKGWDCRDKEGYYLANGVYFYRIIAKSGNKEIIKTKKMAILK